MFKLTLIRILTCLSLLVSFTACSSTKDSKDAAKKETAGQYIDDSVITTRVKKAIFSEPALKSMQITVKTYKGVVQLSGFVDTPEEVSRASEVAKNVDNVQSVKNDLIVK